MILYPNQETLWRLTLCSGGGWSSLRQLERYDHPDDPEMIRAVEAIGGNATKKKAG